ncbi:hypothetical protein AB0O57_29135 [Streptomyces sp. NPDC091201]|uniref:hypothetical protein n=1 Tax=Streptomyces sp. NPDC091201 TaxID=3155190 RepID=UPI00342F4787
MPKNSRARTLAIRAVMDATGLSYSRAALHLDQQNAGLPARGPVGQLGVQPLLLSASVPAAADRRALAQGLADQLHTLHREATGETYAGRADVIVPARPWEADPTRPGYVDALLLVHAWAARPYDREGEPDAVVNDFHAVAKAWIASQHPAAGPEGGPAILPVQWSVAKVLAERAEVTAHTAAEHEELPEGWAELIAARMAAVTPADGEPRMPESAVQRMALPGMVPNSAGGPGKTSMVWDADGQGQLTAWAPGAEAQQSPRTLQDAGAPAGAEGDKAEGTDLPYRIVDGSFQGWYRLSGDGRYDADSGHRRGLETSTYEQLAATRGPLRPVEPPTAEESAAVKAALAGAGRKAVATLLVAVFRLTEQDAVARRTEGAQSWLLAGREGSHESTSLHRLAWSVGCDLSEKPARYDAAAVTELVRVITGWVSGPGRYVEVAANLAGLFGDVADEAGGWAAVADRYLQRHQRVGHPDEVVEAVQRYLMSQSRTHVHE